MTAIPPSPAPPGKRELAKAQRRDDLINATIVCVAKHGLSGTTIARVTEIAGTSIGLANFHFETKELLFEAVLMTLADRERVLWHSRSLDGSPTAADRIVALVDARFHVQTCEPATLAVWFAFWGDATARSIYRRVVEPIDDERIDLVQALFAELLVDGNYPGIDALDAALTHEALGDGLWLNMLLYPDEYRRAACRDRMLTVLATVFPHHFTRPGS